MSAGSSWEGRAFLSVHDALIINSVRELDKAILAIKIWVLGPWGPLILPIRSHGAIEDNQFTATRRA